MCMTTVGKDAGYNLFGSRHELECLQTNRMVNKKEDTEYDQMTLLYSSFSFLLLFASKYTELSLRLLYMLWFGRIRFSRVVWNRKFYSIRHIWCYIRQCNFVMHMLRHVTKSYCVNWALYRPTMHSVPII